MKFKLIDEAKNEFPVYSHWSVLGVSESVFLPGMVGMPVLGKTGI